MYRNCHTIPALQQARYCGFSHGVDFLERRVRVEFDDRRALKGQAGKIIDLAGKRGGTMIWLARLGDLKAYIESDHQIGPMSNHGVELASFPAGQPAHQPRRTGITESDAVHRPWHFNLGKTICDN